MGHNTENHLKHFIEEYEQTLDSFSLPKSLENDYRILSCLKQRENSEVYLLCKKEAVSEKYILKKGSGPQLARLQQEASMLKLLADIPDAFVPKLISCITEPENGAAFLLRTYIEGCPLSEYYETYAPFSNEELIRLSLQLCRIIHLLHQQMPPVIHRDIKPENFIYSKERQTLSLIDFDIARHYIPSHEEDTLLMGTPSFAAPEQFGFSQSDIRTDIYGIGKTMLFLACGSSDKSALNKTGGSSNSSSRNDTCISDKFRRIISRCISFSPKDRYASVDALIRDLEKAKKASHLPRLPLFLGLPLLLLLIAASLFICSKTLFNEQAPALSPAEAYIPVISDIPVFSNALDSSESPDSWLSESNINLWQYQETLDKILLAYAESDYDRAIFLSEELVRALYENDTLLSLHTKDYADYEEIPADFWEKSPEIMACYMLRYRDCIMQKKLGTYDTELSTYIISSLSYYMTPLPESEPPYALYSYAHCPQEEKTSHYLQALLDYLSGLNTACDAAYGMD